MYLTLITDFTVSFLTIKATHCWCLSLRPLYNITLSVTLSPVPFHLTSARPRSCHLYFSSSRSSSSIFQHVCRVRTFHVPIVVILFIVLNLLYCFIPVAVLSLPS